MKYRCTFYVKFKSLKELRTPHVVIADNKDDAIKKLTIELYGLYKNSSNVIEFKLEDIIEDKLEKPSFDFIKNSIITINDITNTHETRKQAQTNLYNAIYTYSPQMDDDYLSDVLSFCETGHIAHMYDSQKLTENEIIDKVTNELLNQMDYEWVCYYSPELPLNEQYIKAIS